MKFSLKGSEKNKKSYSKGGYANEKKSDFYSVISSNDLINGSCRRGNCTCRGKCNTECI